MFTIDTGESGASQGPWISWTSNGSAEKGFAPRSWVLRDKDANGNKSETVVPAFVSGCVMDLDSLKLGWEKDGAKGTPPERRWNPSISQATQRPDESKKLSGAFAWSRALSVRCAIGGGKAATWEQGSFAAYEAFTKLAKQIEAEWATHSQNGALLPLVQQTGVEKRDLPNGSANIPTLTVAKWVARPDCLKADAPVIATGAPEPAPAPQPVQTPTPVHAPALADDAF
jgi:hypothetical protein